jgi:hypothetical protein
MERVAMVVVLRGPAAAVGAVGMEVVEMVDHQHPPQVVLVVMVV